MEPESSTRARRRAGAAHRRHPHSPAQSRLSDRRLGIDVRPAQAASRQGITRDAGAEPHRQGPRRHRRLRRQHGPGPAVDLRQRHADYPRRAAQARGRRLHQRWTGPGARLQGRAGALHQGRREPRDSRDRRRLQRRCDGPGIAPASDRRKTRERCGAVRARIRHGQRQGLDDGEAGRRRQRQLLLHRFAGRGAEGAGRTGRRHAGHGGQGRQDPGRVQPARRRGVPLDRIREPAAEGSGFQRR